ncbi:MAG: aminomethyl-transferring glycine dehydrogenase [Planctomycetes bacterium]|nr:aminomethyl-transferring glycine dehydrogenase [Planctomycetota bacterium]
MPTLPPQDSFARRHIGPDQPEVDAMLATIGAASLEDLVQATIPDAIRLRQPLDLPPARDERTALEDLAEMAGQNEVWRSYLGMGYHGTITPGVLLRNILENPGWYTAYTPYQAEISQGRLEALLNYQTMVRDLTGLEIANASLLDEATAAAEAMTMCHRLHKGEADTFFVSELCHPQTIAVVQTRARPLGIRVVVGDSRFYAFNPRVFGALVQYPATDGTLLDYEGFCRSAHDAGAFVTVAADLLALVLLRPPGEFGADVVVGSSQRFGVPLGYGGPHAAFLATREHFVRSMPGRMIGVSRDADGQPALRMALQTREQHIRRERATSNICTAQVLLAVVAGGYAVYHGPDGLRRIARRVHAQAATLREGIRRARLEVGDQPFFDTLRVGVGAHRDEILDRARERRINLRTLEPSTLVVSLDETVVDRDLADLLFVFGCPDPLPHVAAAAGEATFPAPFARASAFLTHDVFHSHRSETDMLRYLHRLESKDFSLTSGMIPLGSCTMKLNATAEMAPVTWPGFGALHPFAPVSQARGYRRLFRDLESWLAVITGFDAVSLQPNAGSQGEYAGLLVIRAWQEDRGEGQRDVCLIPHSAHGTNPASAALAGLKVVVVDCDDQGNVDLADLRAKVDAHAKDLAALMMTYPSTHGVFEEGIREACELVHAHGGQVYMDGANLNAQVGLCRPGDIGADVCHLNLHKTFCIPHGGGGPGMGPIAVRAHLAPYLPGHPLASIGGEHAIGPVSAAPWGSASILTISWAYIAMMGADGLRRATEVAILNANYVATRLAKSFKTLYTGRRGRVAHECILDLRRLAKASGIEAEDVAKRLMDYGFHAPTMSFPVAGTLMVEPTESESKRELDRFVEAMLSIRKEIREIEDGRADRADNLLKGAPHTAACVTANEWKHPYSRERAAFPTAATREYKFWPAVRRVDNLHGDRNLVCACVPTEAYAAATAPAPTAAARGLPVGAPATPATPERRSGE